jgi:hypothetical protein
VALATSGIDKKASSVKRQLIEAMVGAMSAIAKTVFIEYISAGPTIIRTAERSFVARAIKSPVRCV